MTLQDTHAVPDAGRDGVVRQGVVGLPMEQDTYSFARMYAARGWKLVALHWVTAAGQCSCGKVGCKAAGKHPRDKEWTERPAPPSRWLRGDGMALNIGILTGTPSGFWVLDFDPADADDAGRELHDTLTGEHGLHPHVRTGGGGYHWRFRLPDFEVRNRQSAGGGRGRTHRLPAGWDVRGEGGQVVAPPSVSAKGAYVELIEGDAPEEPPPYVAPAWLLELIRPVERDAPANHQVSTALPAGTLPGVGGPEVRVNRAGAGEGSAHSPEQVQAYCVATLQYRCQEYASLHDGRRSEVMASFARRLIEISNLAGWAYDSVYPHFEHATLTATANRPSGGYDPHEVPAQWQRAIEHVGDRPAVMPPGLDVMPGFSLAGAAAPTGHGSVADGAAQYGADGPETVTTPAPNVPPPVAALDPPPPPGVTRLQWGAYLRRRADEWARTQIDREKVGDRASAVAALRAELLDTAGIKARPRLQPLIPGLFYRNSLARIIGSSGHGKSFVVLDIAAHIGAGLAWAGRPAVKGSVLWLVAEGEEGVGRRIEAWETLHGRPVENVVYLPRAVNALGPEWDIFCEALTGAAFDMIFLDTQARVTPGADEIDRAEQSMLVEACDRLRAATGACVVLVHHRGSKGSHARGHTEVYGALQTQVYVEKDGPRVTVGAKMANGGKTKDDAEPEDIGFILRSVEIPGQPNEFGMVDPAGRGVALEWVGDAAMVETEETKLSTGERRARALWNVIVEHFNPGDGGERAAIKAMFFDVPEIAKLQPATRRQAWQRSWNALIALGLIAKHVKGARFKIVEVPDQAAAGVLTPNPGKADGAVGVLNHNWELWTDDMESKDLANKA